MEVEKNNSERVIERPGKENINVKLADNTGKKAETAKRTRPLRRVRRFRNTLGSKNNTGVRSKPSTRLRSNKLSNVSRKRQRGLGLRRRGVKIIVRNLTRNVTNKDIKSVFEKIGPLRRCGINWNKTGESKGTAEVEYLYKADAYKACRKLDYKSIKGVPMRLEMKDGQKRILLKRLGDRRNSSTNSTRRLRTRNSYKRKANDSGRRNGSYSKRNSTRMGLRSRTGRRNGSRSERKYRNYN